MWQESGFVIENVIQIATASSPRDTGQVRSHLYRDPLFGGGVFDNLMQLSV